MQKNSMGQYVGLGHNYNMFHYDKHDNRFCMDDITPAVLGGWFDIERRETYCWDWNNELQKEDGDQKNTIMIKTSTPFDKGFYG